MVYKFKKKFKMVKERLCARLTTYNKKSHFNHLDRSHKNKKFIMIMQTWIGLALFPTKTKYKKCLVMCQHHTIVHTYFGCFNFEPFSQPKFCIQPKLSWMVKPLISTTRSHFSKSCSLSIPTFQ